MLARQKALRKRPHADPVHRYLDDLAHFKQPKTDIKTETNSSNGTAENTSSSVGDYEDLEKDITPFRKYLLLNYSLSFYASLESLDSLIHDRLSAQGIADRFEEIQCELQFHVFQFINIENVARDRTYCVFKVL